MHRHRPFADGIALDPALRPTSGFRPVWLIRPAAELHCFDYQSVEPVELTVGENDFFRFQHGALRFEYTDYRHYRNALRRWKAAKDDRAQILVMQQRTGVTATITFADDRTPHEETATNFHDRWLSNCVTFPARR